MGCLKPELWDLKDPIDFGEVATVAGSKIGAEGAPARQDAVLVRRLSAAGAVVTADGGGNPIGQIALKLADIPAATASADSSARTGRPRA